MTWVTVALYTLPMSLAAGLGGLPFFFVKDLSSRSEVVTHVQVPGCV